MDDTTLQLPGCDISSPLAFRIESLRQYLENELEDQQLLDCYQTLQQLKAEDDDTEITNKIFNILGPNKYNLITLVQQLCICESNFFFDQNIKK